jgi:VCBS repeat-containing protein
VAANFSDADGNPLTFSATGLPPGLMINMATGVISGVIDKAASQAGGGVYTVSVTASDGQGGSVSSGFTWTITNPAPIAVNDLASTPEDFPVNINVLANDSDPDGDMLRVTTASAGNGTVVIRPDGTIDYTPGANFNGTDTISYTISDGMGGFATATVTVDVNPVNDPPIAMNDSATTAEDTPVTINVLGNDRDVDGDPLTVIAATSPNGVVTINADGTITFVPNANFNGPTTISYTISDGKGGTATATVTLTVAAVNDGPLANPSTATTSEDTPVILTPLANDTDADGDPLTVTAATASNGTVTINPDGTLRYVPNANFNGTDTITYTISDGKGGTSTSTITITVTPVNDVPVAANDMATTPEDQPVTIPVLGNDTDADGDPLTITSATSPNGTVVINPDGTITFTPNANFNGPATITYTVSDGQGGTATATVSIAVAPVNDPPVAINDVAATNEDTPLRIPVLANDRDADGDPLTVVAASAPHGTVVINADGTISYTPDANFNGTDIITYQISDGKGGFSTATIIVTVRPVNDLPVAANDTGRTNENTPVRVPLLANDSDPDGDPLTVTLATAPNGNVAINPDGSVTYTPRAGFFGTDTITYTISDGKGGTATATATITVVRVNDPPVDGNEVISTIGGVINTIPVLANARDGDGDRLSIFTAKVDVGTVTINPDGTLTYVAPPEFQGVATITYIVSDGRGGFVQSTVTVNVQQATADINALLGGNAPGIPDGWHVDRVRDQTESFIQAPLIVDQTVNDFRSLNATANLHVNRPLLTAVNSLSWLKGTADLGDHPVDDVSRQIDRIRDLRFGADRLFDHRFGDFILKSLTGFSVRQLSTGHDQVMIESIVRDRVIYMEVRDIGADSDPRMVEYQLRSRDGKPLPEWVRMDARGLAIIERPVDAETLHLIVRAIRADGKVFEVPILIQGATGEIQLDEKLAPKKIGAAETLRQSLAKAADNSSDETAALAAAFNGVA